MALNIAADMNIDPMEALFFSVRRAAGRVTWVDNELKLRTDRLARGEEGTTERDVHDWLIESRKERALLARTAKAAVDAGIVEALTRNLELEGQLLGHVLGEVLDELELTPEQRVIAMNTAHNKLLAIEDGSKKVA